MKKRILAVVLILVLIASAISLTACNPYETVKNLAQRMEETQKYTIVGDYQMSFTIFSTSISGTIALTAKVDGDKNYVSYESDFGSEATSMNTTSETYFYVDSNGIRQEISKDGNGEWETSQASNSDDGFGDLSNYFTIDFDWDKFTEDYFDQDGNTLILKEEKYTEFFPTLMAAEIDYFKVSAGLNSLTIEYSMSDSAFVMVMNIKDIGVTTVNIPSA